MQPPPERASSESTPTETAAGKNWSRRDVLRTAGISIAGGMLAVASGANETSAAEKSAGESGSLVESISQSVIFPGRKTGHTWFHPRPCVIPGEGSPRVFMALQGISGSDYFGHVHWTESADRGRTWSEPQPIPGLGRTELDDGWSEGVCDVVPEQHPQSGNLLCIGHNVYYRGGHLARPQRARWPVYVVRRPDGTWTKPARLEWDDPRGSQIYTCNCSQRVLLDGGDVLIPFTFGPMGRKHRSVTSVRCGFDGERLQVKQTGSELTNTRGRGLLEPSLVQYDGRFFVTIRAEDGRGYVSSSTDGLDWQQETAWAWEDGTPLGMSTTQQHWLPHADGLHLVYTRRDAGNQKVFRWRAPVYMARVDLNTMRLQRDTERVVLPLLGDAAGDPGHVARMGNFHPLNVTAEEAWVTAGEARPADGWKGDTLLARIRWSKPNPLAGVQ